MFHGGARSRTHSLRHRQGSYRMLLLSWLGNSCCSNPLQADTSKVALVPILFCFCRVQKGTCKSTKQSGRTQNGECDNKSAVVSRIRLCAVKARSTMINRTFAGSSARRWRHSKDEATVSTPLGSCFPSLCPL